MLFFSKSTGAFYDAHIHGDAIPADAVEITTDEHQALLAAQSGGKIIASDADGKPVAVDPPPPTTAERATTMRAQRDKLMDSTQWLVARHRDQVDGGMPTTLTAEQYKGLLAFRQALRDLPEQNGFPDVSFPKPTDFLPAQ